MEHQNDNELHELLREWKAPATPAGLEARVLQQDHPWWRMLVHGYIRVPVPIACCVGALMIGGAWRLATLPAAGCPTASLIAPRIVQTDGPGNVHKQSAAKPCAARSTC